VPEEPIKLSEGTRVVKQVVPCPLDDIQETREAQPEGPEMEVFACQELSIQGEQQWGMVQAERR
jgi:hypothetical protein